MEDEHDEDDTQNRPSGCHSEHQSQELQNDVDAGYVRPMVAGQGRGRVRLYSFENVVQLKVLDILVRAYGLERQCAATMLARAWPPRFTKRTRVLIIPPAVTTIEEGIDLEPIRLPLGGIVESTSSASTAFLSITTRKHEVVQLGGPSRCAKR